MTDLLFSAEADRILSRMEGDESQRHCAGRIHTALDLLETDPGNARNRRRHFHTIGLWGIAVLCGDDEWLILWETHDEKAVVRHIIPTPWSQSRTAGSPVLQTQQCLPERARGAPSL